jgi:hypothetical protein
MMFFRNRGRLAAPVRILLVALGAAAGALVACDDEGGAADAGPDAGVPDIADLVFGDFEPFAEPIADYIATNAEILGHQSFLTGIFDLQVAEDRLYLGYGDANLNLGQNTPIELRYFAEPDPAAVTAEFATDEEQVDRYRLQGDLLMVPGVDATEDGLLGNAYTRAAGGEWVKSRTLDLAWHVHDIASLAGAIYACGSGGTLEDYNQSTVNALFYRSDDNGETFETLEQIPHPTPPGDQRLTDLLAVGSDLYAFGYVSEFIDNQNTITQLIAYRLDGDGLVAHAGWSSFWVTDTEALSTDLGVVVGVDTSGDLNWECRLVSSDGAVEQGPFCAGLTVLDIAALGDGRGLVAYLPIDDYPVTAPAGLYGLNVGLTADGESLLDLVTQNVESFPRAIAFWRGDLYLGLDDGSVWRAVGAPAG